jgi:hypothetical protein
MDDDRSERGLSPTGRSTAAAAASIADPAQAYLGGIFASDGAPCAPPSAAIRESLLALARAWRAPGQPPQDLVGRPCPAPAPLWHLAQLEAALADGGDGPIESARRRFHARCLGHLLYSDRPEQRPTVTVLIPVYNRAAKAAEAVASCLAQTWRPLEILVVDDGSTDDLAGALREFGPTVRLLRQANGGVSSARNAGIRAATGDFVHFLDSDNLLLPDAVAAKLDAFARIADAGLCYSTAEVRGDKGPMRGEPAPPDGSEHCPTTDLLEVLPHYPFYVSCSMLPRWLLLASGGFEEDLRRAEDSRLWFTLALRGTKVIGLKTALTVRRLTPGSLSVGEQVSRDSLVVALRNATDRLRGEHACRSATRGFRSLLRRSRAITDASGSDARIKSATAHLLAALRMLGDGQRRGGVSPLPLLAYLRHVVLGAIAECADAGDEPPDLLNALLAAVNDAARNAAALSAADIEFWRNAAFRRREIHRLNVFLGRVNARLSRDPASVSLCDEILRHDGLVPTKRQFKTYRRLRRFRLPLPLALRLARRHADPSPSTDSP